MHTRTEGIVLKEIRFRETSKILTIFTKKHGKISAMARGAYRPRSQLIANTQHFTYNEYYLYKGKNFYYINQAIILDSHYPIRESLNRLMYGSYLLELTEVSNLEEEPNEKLFLLLRKGLNVLSNLNKDFLKFILAYEVKYVSFLGFKPFIDKCVNCGNKDLTTLIFSIDLGGILCNRCKVKDYYGHHMDFDMYRGLSALLYTPLDQLDGINIPKDTLFKLHNLMVKYILDKIEVKEFRSLKMLKSMRESGGL